MSSRYHHPKRTLLAPGQNPAADAAVGALRPLVGPDDWATRAYAEATWQSLRDAWIARHRVTASRSEETCWCLLGGPKCPDPMRIGNHDHGTGWQDHGELWVRDGRPVVYVSQPYGIRAEGVQHLAALRAERGFDIRVDTDSWHFPGSTLLIEVWAPGEFERRPGA